MKNRIVLGLSFLSVCLLTACSFSVPFVIENRSGNPISVRFKVKNWNNRPVQLIRDLSKRSDSNQNEWKQIPQEIYKVDNQSETVEVNLPPNHALQLGSADPYYIHREPYGDHFKLKMLEITGDNGSIKLEGNQVFEMFEEQKSGFNIFEPSVNAYVIRYKESKNAGTSE